VLVYKKLIKRRKFPLKKFNALLLVLAVAVLVLVGCGNSTPKSEFVLLRTEYLYSDKTDDGTDFAEGFIFATDDLYYVMYADGELVLEEKWGTWDRSGDIITLYFDDGSTTIAEISEKRDVSDGIKEAYKITVGEITYTLKR
jgi:hypothetical protein